MCVRYTLTRDEAVIWSTDWWHDSEAETQKLLAFIRDLPKPT
jgi:hypothetical protein